MQAEEEVWAQIDHDLVGLKKDPVARQLERKYQSRKTQIYLKGQTRATEWTVPLKMARLFIEQTKEWIESLYQIYGSCGGWRSWVSLRRWKDTDLPLA